MGSEINQLSQLQPIQGSDQLVFYSSANGDARRGSVTALQQYLEDNQSSNSQSQQEYLTQYAAPSSTGFTVVVTNGETSNNQNIHLILTPTAGFADGAITLPIATGANDKQEVLVNCTQAVTNLVVNLNGASGALGAPTTLAANDFFRLKFDKPTLNWYRVG